MVAVSKKELVSLVASQLKNVNESQTKDVINKFIDVVVEQLGNGAKITLQGFGVFDAPVKPARTRFNPLVQKEIHTPERRVPKFTPAKAFKDFIGQKKV